LGRIAIPSHVLIPVEMFYCVYLMEHPFEKLCVGPGETHLSHKMLNTGCPFSFVHSTQINSHRNQCSSTIWNSSAWLSAAEIPQDWGLASILKYSDLPQRYLRRKIVIILIVEVTIEYKLVSSDKPAKFSMADMSDKKWLLIQ
jgi:hypothetical protein